MNPASDTAPAPALEIPGLDKDSQTPSPANWREALLALLTSRVALLGLESKEAAKNAARRASLLFALVFCLWFMWALLLAGGIAALAQTSGWPWYWIAIAAGVIHIGAATLLARAAKAPQPPAFPVTRAEFQKDHEWIETFQKNRKSND
jgi:MFS family permease